MATATKVRISRTRALRLLEWAQWKSADKWDNERMGLKIKDINDVLPEGKDPEDEDVANTLLEVRVGIEEGSDFDIFSEEGENSKADKKSSKAKAENKAEKTEPEQPKPVEPKPHPGARSTKSRTYVAAQVYKDVGLAVGVTDEVIAEVDKRFGKANKNESWAACSSAWHALNGYLEEFDVSEPAQKKAEEKTEEEAPVEA